MGPRLYPVLRRKRKHYVRTRASPSRECRRLWPVPTFNHGALALELPSDWSDRTMIMFAAPQGADHGVVNVSVSWVEAETPATLLKRKLDELTEVDPGATLLSQGKLECSLGVGAFYEVQVSMGDVVMRQILGVVLKDGLAFNLAASATVAHFEKVAPRLWEILRSVRVGSSA
jgi:hypothetical protein